MCEGDVDLAPCLLGQGQDNKKWVWVLNASGDQLLEFTPGRDLDFVDLRSLMADLPVEDLAVAGHAVALSQWHQVLQASFFLMFGGQRSRCMLLSLELCSANCNFELMSPAISSS